MVKSIRINMEVGCNEASPESPDHARHRNKDDATGSFHPVQRLTTPILQSRKNL